MEDTTNSLKQGNPSHLQMRAVLLGFSGSGKTSSRNTILNQRSQGTNYNKVQAEIARQQILMVDTPGWSNESSSDETLERIRKEMEHGISQCHPGPHAVLLVVSADAQFGEERRRRFEECVQLLGETVWSHTMVLFTYGGGPRDKTVEQHIDGEGEPLRWLVERCGGRYHALDNGSRGGDDGGTQVTELLEKMEKMVVTNTEEYFEYVKQRKDGSETVEVNTVAEEDDDWLHHLRRKRNSQGIIRPSLGGEDKPVAEFLSSSVSDSCSTPTSSGYGSLIISPTESLNNSVFGSFTSSMACSPHGPAWDSSQSRSGSGQPDLD